MKDVLDDTPPRQQDAFLKYLPPRTAEELYRRYLAKYPKYLSDIAYIRMIKKELTSA